MIGTDCGTSPTKWSEDLPTFVAEVLEEYQSPPPLPSSFHDDAHLETRFRFLLNEESFHIIPLEADRPLTEEKLRSHGVEIANVWAGVECLIAGLRNCPSEEVTVSDATVAEDGGLSLAVRFPEPADKRFDHVTAEISGSYVEVTFALKSEASEPAPSHDSEGQRGQA